MPQNTAACELYADAVMSAFSGAQTHVIVALQIFKVMLGQEGYLVFHRRWLC